MQKYNAPDAGQQSTIGNQLQTFFYQKKALIELVKERYFGQLADVTSMPKNFGKKLKRYHYLPLLDDANLNDQGIDAAGVTITGTEWFVSFPDVALKIANASAAAAKTAIDDNTSGLVCTNGAADSGGTGFTTLTLNKQIAKYATATKRNAVQALNLGVTAQQGSGNLYGSSKDIGLINGKMPLLSETGGRVNRVGFKRKEIEGTFEKFGFFDEYTQESLDFDSDAELEMHINREMLRGANEMTEDALQIDLLSTAGTVKYAGNATSRATIGSDDLVTYTDLMKLSIDLDNNRTPKHTKVITGSRMVDTKTLPAARVAYIGSELIPTFKAMKDLHNERAFIPIEKYADAGNTVTGEIGAVDQFRLVVGWRRRGRFGRRDLLRDQRPLRRLPDPGRGRRELHHHRFPDRWQVGEVQDLPQEAGRSHGRPERSVRRDGLHVHQVVLRLHGAASRAHRPDPDGRQALSQSW
jgi:N4-gp56 family major capsid protein